MRFAIWAAVSTEAQAREDKVSLIEQEQRCREVARSKGWKETAGPFIVPGQSRTRWVNLRDAEIAIPQLRQMLDDAHARRFDVLVLYDYNRLRDLLDPVGRTLAHYNVQVYSISQPVEPQPPEKFSPYSVDSAWMMQGLSQIISRAQIADLRRKYQYAMPRRVSEKGLPSHSIPFGYRKPPGREHDRNAIPVQDPLKVKLILELKDLLFQGYSLRQLANHAQNSGIAPPRSNRWYPQTIRGILSNPFYAGKVRWGITRSYLDPRTGKRYRQHDVPSKDIIIAQGKHEPLWDERTHEDIMRELERRHINYKGKQNHALTGLLRCGVCESPMWQFRNGTRSEPDRRVWRCSRQRKHISIPYTEANLRVADTLLKLIQAHIDDLSVLIQEEPGKDYVNTIKAALSELEKQRTRLEDAYQAGVISLESLSRRLGAIDQKAEALEHELAAMTDDQDQLAKRIDTMKQLAQIGNADDLAAFFANGPQLVINRALHTIISHITVSSDGISVKFKKKTPSGGRFCQVSWR